MNKLLPLPQTLFFYISPIRGGGGFVQFYKKEGFVIKLKRALVRMCPYLERVGGVGVASLSSKVTAKKSITNYLFGIWFCHFYIKKLPLKNITYRIYKFYFLSKKKDLFFLKHSIFKRLVVSTLPPLPGSPV